VGALSGNSLADFRRIPPAAPSKSFGGFLPSSSVYIDVQYIKIRSSTRYVLFLNCQKGKKIQMYHIYNHS
jgi:hypothetical protein